MSWFIGSSYVLLLSLNFCFLSSATALRKPCPASSLSSLCPCSISEHCWRKPHHHTPSVEPKWSHIGPQHCSSSLHFSTIYHLKLSLFSFSKPKPYYFSTLTTGRRHSLPTFVGKSEVTREKFPHIPATNLQISLYFRFSPLSQICHIADDNVLICLPTTNRLMAACNSFLQGFILFIFLYSFFI